MSADNIRKVLLEIISDSPGTDFQAGTVLRDAQQRLGLGRDEGAQRLVLTIWHDFFRNGLIAPGCNLSNPNLPFCHLTERGRKTLEQFGRDPSNPDGYIAYAKSKGSLGKVAASYVAEALATYNSGCFKATSVMIGAATESVVLGVRDELVAGHKRAGESVPPKMKQWQYKSVRDAITHALNGKRSAMPDSLEAKYTAFWTSLTEQPRSVRNDAGHPSSVDPVTPESVHAALLIFPELLNVCDGLRDWIKKEYV